MHRIWTESSSATGGAVEENSKRQGSAVPPVAIQLVVPIRNQFHPIESLFILGTIAVPREQLPRSCSGGGGLPLTKMAATLTRRPNKQKQPVQYLGTYTPIPHITHVNYATWDYIVALV